MTILTITSKGQVTFKKALLEHLGAAPGRRLDVDLLPGGRIEVKAAPAEDDIGGFIGSLAGVTSRRATLRQIADVAAAGWAGTAPSAATRPTKSRR